MTEGISALADSRRRLTELVTGTVLQMAQVIQDEQAELARRFPAMADQPATVMIAPAAIRDFTQSDEFRQAVDEYVAGRLEVNLLVKVVDLLQRIAPLEFVRR